MQNVSVDVAVSAYEVTKSPPALLRLAVGTVLNHSGVMDYKDPAEAYEAMIEFLDDLELAQVVKARIEVGEKPVRVSFDDLIGEAEIDIESGLSVGAESAEGT